MYKSRRGHTDWHKLLDVLKNLTPINYTIYWKLDPKPLVEIYPYTPFVKVKKILYTTKETIVCLTFMGFGELWSKSYLGVDL